MMLKPSSLVTTFLNVVYTLITYGTSSKTNLLLDSTQNQIKIMQPKIHCYAYLWLLKANITLQLKTF